MEAMKVVFLFLRSLLPSRASLAAENLALRQQLAALQPRMRRPKLRRRDRLFWVWLLRLWSGWTSALVIVKPETVLRHERRRVAYFNVTEDPSATWAAQQIIEAFPYDEAPR